MLHIFKVAVLGHIYRRMRPVPRVVGSVVAVEHVVACVLQIFCRPLGLFHVAPCFLEFLSRKSAPAHSLGLGYHTVAQGYRKIFAASLLDRLHDLDREAVAVLKRSAVFICAVVHIFESELVQQIALMHSVDLHAVHSRVFQKLCALGKRLHELLYFLHRHGS